MIGRRASLVALSLLGLGEAARWSGQQAAPSRGKFGLPSLDTMKEKLPKIELPWSRDEMYELEEEEEESGLGRVAKAVIGATLTAAGSVGASFAYRMFQAKQRRQQAGGLAFESVPKIPKGGKSDMKGTQTTAAPPAAFAKAAPEPKEAPAAAAEGAEGEKEEEKVYDVLPVEELDVSTLTDEQKEHFKAKMFGLKLVKYEGDKFVEVAAKDVLEGKYTFIFFYHPDVDEYTKKAGLPSSLSNIVKAYNKLKDEGKPVEFVFVSLVYPEGRFQETLKQMPFYGMPMSEKERIISILQTLRVSQLPSMVILDPENRLVNLRGYHYMNTDPEGFPWKYKTVDDLLSSQPLVDRDGEEHLHEDAIVGKKSIALYFSASWCKPCKEFTPRLVEMYNKKKAEGEDMEIVFISLDEDEEKFKAYLQEMPWLAVKFGNKAARTLLMSDLGVQGLPTLITFDDKRRPITTRGREFAVKDPEGLKYPWHPEPVNELGWNHDGLVQRPSLVVFMENAEGEAQGSVVSSLQKLGEEHEAGFKIDPEDPLSQMKFFYAKEVSAMSAGLRSLASLPQVNPKDKFLKKGTEGKKPVVALFDIPKQAYYVNTDLDTVGEDELRSIVKQYYDGELAMEPIKVEEGPAGEGEQAAGEQ